MKITFPHMGNTFVCVKALLDEFKLDYIIPPYNNKNSLEIGSRYVPELACLPLKITIGNIIQAWEKGADTVLMTGGRGPCRFGYYCEMYKQILDDIGCKMDVITLEWPDKGFFEFLRRVKRASGTVNPYKIIKAVKNATQIAIKTDEIEKLSFYVRPREVIKGSTDHIYGKFLFDVQKARGSREINKIIERTRDQIMSIDIKKDFKPLRVGIVGEIYSIIDPFTSFNIQTRLGNMGVEADRKVTVSNWIVEHMIKNALHLPRNMEYANEAKPYLETMIGGHAQETIGYSALYAKNEYDGIIHIYPLSCMPEIVAKSILPQIQKEYGIPVMSITIDEMTGEAGYITRLEAFIDLLHEKRTKEAV